MIDAHTNQSLLKPGPQGVATKHLTLFADLGQWAIVTRDGDGNVQATQTVTVGQVLGLVAADRREWVLSHTRNALATLGHQLADRVASGHEADADTVLCGMALHTLREQLTHAEAA